MNPWIVKWKIFQRNMKRLKLSKIYLNPSFPGFPKDFRWASRLYLWDKKDLSDYWFHRTSTELTIVSRTLYLTKYRNVKSFLHWKSITIYMTMAYIQYIFLMKLLKKVKYKLFKKKKHCSNWICGFEVKVYWRRVLNWFSRVTLNKFVIRFYCF